MEMEILGSFDPDIHNIELIDNRKNLVFTYHLSLRESAGNEMTIQGAIDVILDNIILLNKNNASKTPIFSIKIKDKADNWSSLLTSETITITQ